jgi:death-on-curing protein
MIEPVWLDEQVALTLHDRLLTLQGGASGVRDETLLKSALARPRQHWVYTNVPDLIVLAAVYTGGIVGNHPFVDGNKRTGFMMGVLFLELNGFAFTASQEDAAQAVIALASGVLNEDDYAAFLRGNVTASNGMR